MATALRAELSEKSRYYVEKHRMYELKHFCLQYPSWKRTCIELDGMNRPGEDLSGVRTNTPGDPTGLCVELRTAYLNRMDLVRRTAYEADPDLASYIFIGVTEGVSYNYLKTKLDIPCGKDMYYDRYRRFFWLLDNARN